MRSWEGTHLKDTPDNRRLVQARAILIEAEMKASIFNYLKWFPHGNRAHLFDRARSNSKPITVGDYFAQWIQKKTPPLIRKSAERDYRQHFGAYILPSYRDVMLEDVTTATLETLRFQLLHELDLTVKTARNIIDGSFRAMLRDARLVDQLIENDPFVGLTWPDKIEPEPDPFTGVERDQILDHFKRRLPFYHPFVYFLFWTGMRPSEATALRWGDIDLPKGTASITKSRHLQSEASPKTKGSRRVVHLLPTVVEVLSGTKPLRVTESSYVFLNKDGRPIDSGNWAKDYWFAPMRAHGIRERKFYSTRHTYISTALSAGVNIKWISEQCGTSVTMIEKHYGKYIGTEGDAPLRDLLAGKSANESANLPPSHQKTTINQKATWRPRRDLNPDASPSQPSAKPTKKPDKSKKSGDSR